MPFRDFTFSTAERRHVYFVVAAIIVVCWVLDVGVAATLPLDTLVVRLVWAALFVVAGISTDRLPPKASSLVESGAVGVSTLALAIIAALTGGMHSPFFFMLPFLPVMVAQVEQTHALSVQVSTATVLIAGLVTIYSQGATAFALVGWALLTGFTGWWGRFWFLRMERIRHAELERERARTEAEAGRARALEALAKAEQERAQAEKLSLIGRLATGVAHEVNNPLAFVTSNLEFLRDALAAGQLRDICDESLIGAERIRQIVADLRSFARREEPASPEDVDARSVIEEALRLASVRLRGMTVVCVDLPAALPSVSAHRGKLVQVLLNLLVNAADAVEKAEKPEIRLGARTSGGAVSISVDDNGSGVADHVAARLFEPFFTTKAEAGMGLGLALSQEYLRSQGGSIRLETSPLGGARFTIEIPVTVRAAA